MGGVTVGMGVPVGVPVGVDWCESDESWTQCCVERVFG